MITKYVLVDKLTVDSFQAAYEKLTFVDNFDEELPPTQEMPAFNKNGDYLPDMITSLEGAIKNNLGGNWIEKINSYRLYCFFYPHTQRCQIHFHSVITLKPEYGGGILRIVFAVALEVLTRG